MQGKLEAKHYVAIATSSMLSIMITYFGMKYKTFYSNKQMITDDGSSGDNNKSKDSI
mgnify:CR=1 FL=1